jgi:dienelactone hydrolase
MSPRSQALPVEADREGPGAHSAPRGADIHAVRRTEAALLRVAVGVVALHVLDDNFLQPQPGTSAGEHLVSALVPCAVLLAAVALLPRLRAGLRASVAAAIGLFGIVAGIEAFYYARAGQLSGDDYTGLAAAAAGVFLIAASAVTLWRTRRVDGSRLRRWLRRALVAGATVVVTYVVIAPFLASYVLTHTARSFVPADHVGARHEDVSFTTSDGLRLRGWYVPSKNGAAVISFPGRQGTQKPARLLARHGYGVLLFDRRGEGESQGDPNAWGWDGYRDVDAAVRFLRGRPDVHDDRIGGIGLSVGGEMMLEAAARSKGLKAVVAEGAGERSIHELLDMTGNDKWLALASYAPLTAGIALFSADAPPPSLADLVGRIAPTPVFFIYGEHGQDGERNLNPTYFAAAHAPKTLWRVPGSGHVGGIEAQQKHYERRVVGFFDRALLNAQS